VIYLASTSPRRKTLLRKAKIKFRILKPRYEENNNLKGSPSKIVKIHAVKKAESCIKQVRDGTILSADTIVYFRGEIISKPKNMKKAHLMLQKLQDRWHTVFTGVALFRVISGKRVKKTVFVTTTKVRLRPLTSQGIKNYFKKVNPLDKAGAYAIQSPRGGMVREVKGLFSNAVGLPIEKILPKLRKNS
jgi:septum formation protein